MQDAQGLRRPPCAPAAAAATVAAHRLPPPSGPPCSTLLQPRTTAMRLPLLASQTFAGSPLIRGAGARRLDALLAGEGGQEALFALVADRQVAVTTTSSGPSSGGTAVHWLDRAGLAAMDVTYAGQGEQLSIGGSQAAAPVYFLGEDRRQRTLRLAVDVSAAPPGWAQQRAIRLQVCCLQEGGEGVVAAAGSAVASQCRKQQASYTPLPAGPALAHEPAAGRGAGGGRHGRGGALQAAGWFLLPPAAGGSSAGCGACPAMATRFFPCPLPAFFCPQATPWRCPSGTRRTCSARAAARPACPPRPARGGSAPRSRRTSRWGGGGCRGIRAAALQDARRPC